MTELNKNLVSDLETVTWVVKDKDFGGFSQVHKLKCRPPASPNSCSIYLSMLTPDLSKGKITIEKRRRKCRNCPIQEFASELKIPFVQQKRPSSPE